VRKSKFAAFLRHGREMTSRRIIGHTRLTGRFTHRSREDRRRRRLTGHAAAPRRGAAPGRSLAPVHDAEDCVKIKILWRVRAESSRRPPRHRGGACSMAWRCRFLTARRAPDTLIDFQTGRRRTTSSATGRARSRRGSSNSPASGRRCTAGPARRGRRAPAG
jgi:hypothetical protein